MSSSSAFRPTNCLASGTGLAKSYGFVACDRSTITLLALWPQLRRGQHTTSRLGRYGLPKLRSRDRIHERVEARHMLSASRRKRAARLGQTQGTHHPATIDRTEFSTPSAPEGSCSECSTRRGCSV